MTAIAICGTFDLENYGDLLFPRIAAHELQQRLGIVPLECFSYSARSAASWPFAVTSLRDFAAKVEQLRGLIVGGGHLIRFDKLIAPDYFPPAELHHPLSLWLTPVLLALTHGLPVVWNAPAVHGEIPAWITPLLGPALAGSRYIAVRDAASRRALAAFARGAEIAVVPDTVFGIAALLPEQASPALTALREQIGLQRPYLVLQTTGGLDAIVHLLQRHAERFADYQILLLPIGPVLGDAVSALASLPPHAVRLPQWPEPLLLAELIAGAEAAIGVSLHLAITALACGVPVFRPDDATHGKYGLLADYEAIFLFEPDAEISPDWLLPKLGRRAPSAAAQAAWRQLQTHWDRIAAVFAASEPQTVPIALRESWQALPGALEAGAQWQARHAEAQRDAEALREEVASLRQSLSWRLTAPLRALLDLLRGRPAAAATSGSPAPATPAAPRAMAAAPDVSIPATPVLRFEVIESRELRREPYAWTPIDGLYAPADAAALAASFPRDHYKTVKGYDGEKDYGYEARELIGMGSALISNAADLSPVWRRLAADLLSPRYRAALSRLSGIDLSLLPFEANVFHYGPGAWLGPHLDLRDKLVTHVLYFNPHWNIADGGCLNILNSSRMEDVAEIVPPIVGNSALLLRSERSWHAVSRVAPSCAESRRSMTVTFYRPQSISTMWPPGDTTPTHVYA